MQNNYSLTPEALEVFKSVPEKYLVLSPDLNILTASDAYLAATLTQRQEIMGKPIFEVFPDNPAVPKINSVSKLNASLQTVLSTLRPHEMAVQRYDVPRPTSLGGGFEEKYWESKNVPVLNGEGELLYIIHKVKDVTERIKNQDQIQKLALRESKAVFEADWERNKLQSIFIQAPAAIAVIEGIDQVYTLANPLYQQLFNRTEAQLLGNTFREVFPEVKPQNLPELFAQVFRSGNAYTASEFTVVFDRTGDGTLDKGYFNFVAQPLMDSHGQVYAIMIHAVEVTDQVLARQEIEERKEKYSSLFKKMEQGFCIIELLFDADNYPVDYRFLEYNAVFEAQTGLKNAVGKTARELVPKLESHWFDIYGNVALTGKSTRFVEGSQAMGRWFEVHAFRLGGAESRRVALLFTDISNRKKAENELRESEERFSSIFNQTSVGIAQTTPSGKFILVNDRYAEIVGRSKKELYQLTLQDLTHPEDLKANIPLLEAVVKEGQPFKIEKRYIRKDGSFIWVNMNVSAIRDKGGQPRYILGVCHDITDRRQAEERLKQSNLLYEYVNKATQDTIWNWDLVEHTIRWNERTQRMFNYSPEEIPVEESWWYENIHPEDRERVVGGIHEVIDSGMDHWSDEYRFCTGNGDYKIVYDRGFVLHDEDGAAFRMIGSMQDITDRKKAEEEKQKLIAILETSTDYVGLASLDGKGMYVNAAGLKMVGWDSWENRSIIENIYPEDRPLAKQVLLPKLFKEGHFSHEIRFWNEKTGKPVWVLWNGLAIKKTGTNEIIALATISPDITERKHAEQTLKESEERFRVLADQVPQFIWMTDSTGNNVNYCNKTFLDYLGLSSVSENLGIVWKEFIHPDDLEEVSNVYQPKLETRELFTVACRIKEAATGEYKWILIRGVPRFGADQKFAGYIGTGVDINDQKNMFEQLEASNAQLKRINNDLDNFIYTASHDLKAPISNIEGLVNLLHKTLSVENKENEKVETVMEMIHKSINRFQNVIKDLAEVAKVQNEGEEDLSEISFAETLEEVKINIKHQIDESNAVIRDDFSQAPEVYFSKKNLRSILYNLLSNAIKYRSPNRPIQVDITSSRPDDTFLLLTVRDNGLGIKEKDKSKVFMMFKRLHQHVEGTGIGMAIVKKIVDNNGGKIDIESEQENGTQFKVYLRQNNAASSST